MSQRDMASLQVIWQHLTNLLIEPVPQNAPERARSRFLATVLIFFIPAAVLVAIMPQFTDPEYVFSEDIGFWPSIATFAGFAVAYLMCRAGYFFAASRLMLTIMIVMAYLLAIIDTSGNYIGLLGFLFVPVLLASYLESAKVTVYMAVVNLVSLLLLPSLFDHITLESILNGPFSIGLLMSVFIVPMTYYQEKTRTQREKELEQSTERFRQIVELYTDSVAIESDGMYIYINRRGLHMLGAKKASEVIGHPVSDFVHPDYRNEISARLVRHAGDDAISYVSIERMIRVDGSPIDVEISAMATSFEGRVATQKIIKPIGDVRRTRRVAGRYRQVVEAIAEMVLVLNREGKILDMNAAATTRLGYLVGNSINTVLTDENRPTIDHVAEIEVKALTDTGSLQTSLLDKAGKPIPVSLRYIKDADGGIIVASDQTERRITHEVIQQAEERFARVFNSNVIGIGISTFAEGRFIDVNDYFLSCLGFTRDEVIGATARKLEIYPEGDDQMLERRQELLDKLAQTGAVHNHRFQLRTRSGELREMNSTLELINLGGEQCILNLMQDITGQVEAETALSESEARYRTVSDLMSDYAYYINVTEKGDMIVDWITGAFTNITGYTYVDAVNWNQWLEFVHEDDLPLVRQHTRRLLKGKPGYVEFRLRARDGSTRWIHQSDRPVLSQNGTHRVIGIYGASQDVTGRLEAESALRDHALQQAVVAELGQSALERGEDGRLHEEAVRLTAHVLDADMCLLWLIDDEDDQTLILRDSALTNPRAIPLQTTRLNIKDNTQASYTLQAGDPLIIGDFLEEERFKDCEPVVTTGVRSSTSVGIYGQESRPLGVIVAHSMTPDFFNLDDANYLQSIANVIAAYVEQKRAEKAERTQRQLAEAMRDTAAILNSSLDLDYIFDRMLENLAAFVPYDTASLMVLNNKGAQIIRHRGFEQFGLAATALERVIVPRKNIFLDVMLKQGEAVVIPDVHEDANWFPIAGTEFIRSYVGAPIHSQGEVIGIINVDNKTPNTYSSVHAERLMIFAHHAAIALSNARHAEELEIRVNKRTAAHELEHKRLQTVLDASGEGILYTENMQILYANQLLADLIGSSVDQIIGKTPDEIVPIKTADGQSLGWVAIQQQLIDEPVIRREIVLTRNNNTEFDAGLTISYYGDPDKLMRMVVIVRDISSAKELDKQKTRFIADASHELRTPLQTMDTLLYLLTKDEENFEKHARDLGQVMDHTSNLVNELLDLSRFESGMMKIKPVDVILQRLVEETTQILGHIARKEQISLTDELLEKPTHVYVDSARIKQVLHNLIGNAINYTQEGGFVHVTMRQDTEWTTISVRDNGTGIAEEDLENIFEPFFRANKDKPGTGLGLSISATIIKLHHGKITVESELGVGSTFTIWLPSISSAKRFL